MQVLVTRTRTCLPCTNRGDVLRTRSTVSGCLLNAALRNGLALFVFAASACLRSALNVERAHAREQRAGRTWHIASNNAATQSMLRDENENESGRDRSRAPTRPPSRGEPSRAHRTRTGGGEERRG